MVWHPHTSRCSSSIQALKKSYLLCADGQVVERPQFMHMRTAIAVCGGDLGAILETYDALSRHLYTHASPVLFNAGSRCGTFASCYLYQSDGCSPSDLLSTVASLDQFWLAQGGVGVSVSNVPCKRCVHTNSASGAFHSLTPLCPIPHCSTDNTGPYPVLRPVFCLC